MRHLRWLFPMFLFAALVTPVEASAAPVQSIFGPPGYWMVASDGGIFTFGNGATFYGSTAGQNSGSPTVGMAAYDGHGYWELSRSDQLTPYGDADVTATTGSAVAMTALFVNLVLVTNASGQVTEVGGPTSPLKSQTFNCLSTPPNKPIVGIADAGFGVDPATGNPAPAYWLVASDGGVFACNGAPFLGSMGGQSLNAPIVGIAPRDDDRGYWLVASDGGIFAFGSAQFLGSMGGEPLNKPIVGMAPYVVANGPYPIPQGYWEVASDGGIFSFGGAPFLGSMGGQTLNAPIVGMAPAPVTYCCFTG